MVEHLLSMYQTLCLNPHPDKKENQVISTHLGYVQNVAQTKLSEMINYVIQIPFVRTKLDY